MALSGKIVINNERINSWIIISLAFLFPVIALINYLFNIQSGMLSQCYRAMNLFISLIIIIYVILKSFEKKKLMVHPGFLLFILFWIIFIVRLVIDLELLEIHKESGYPKIYYYSFSIGITLLPAVAAAFIKPIDIQILLRELKKVLIALNIIILLIYFKEIIIRHAAFFRFYLERGDMPLLNSITIGTYAALLILICLFDSKKTHRNYLYILISTINLFACASKGPLLFVLIVILIASLYNLKLFFKSTTDLLVKTILSSIILVTTFFFGPSMMVFERIINLSSDQSSSIRTKILSDAAEQFLSEPILGSHFLVIKTNFYSHNLLLDVLLANGLLGMLLLLPVFIIFFCVLFKNKFKSPFLLIALFLFFCSNTSGSVYSSNEFWITLAIILTNQYQFIDQKKIIYQETIKPNI
jgi:hypothetical protein